MELLAALKRRRSGGDQLLAYREGRRWHDVRSEQINDYLKGLIGEAYTAKDFRTWNATMLAAVSLAADGRDAATKAARKRAMDGAVRGVAEVLGNTRAVARRSYIDPRVFDRYLSGWTIGAELDRIGSLRGPDDRRRARLERAVLDLIEDDRDSSAVERFAPADPGRREPFRHSSTNTRSTRDDARAVIQHLLSATLGGQRWRSRLRLSWPSVRESCSIVGIGHMMCAIVTL